MERLIIRMESINKTVCQIFNGKLKHVSRFSMVGIANTLVDFLVFTISYNIIGFGYGISQVAGYSFGIINSFIFNRRWTFQARSSNKKAFYELLKFIAVNMISLCLSVSAMDFMAGRLNLNVYLAKVIVTLLAQVTNFLGYKLWVFQLEG